MKFSSIRKTTLALLSSTAITVLTFAIAPSTALAQQVWDGDTSDDFSLNTNWAGDVLPGVGDTAQINDGASAPIVSADQTINILDLDLGTLTINGATTLTATTSTDISGGTLSGAGTLATGTYSQSAGTVNISTIDASTAFNFPATGILSLGSVLTGAGVLTKTAAGILILSGDNSFSGGLSNNAIGSTVILQHNNAAGIGTITAGNGTMRQVEVVLAILSPLQVQLLIMQME